MNKPNPASVDLNKAFLDPGSVFSTPEDVRDHPGLTRSQKIVILRRWEYDANQVSLAEDEGMQGGEPSLLDRVVQVLDVLTGDD